MQLNGLRFACRGCAVGLDARLRISRISGPGLGGCVCASSILQRKPKRQRVTYDEVASGVVVHAEPLTKRLGMSTLR